MFAVADSGRQNKRRWRDVVESHLAERNQSLESGQPLTYGKALLTPRIGWYRCAARQLSAAVKARRG